MLPDPYPDLLGAALPDPARSRSQDDWPPQQSSELSEADRRLLAVLSQPQPPVVTAVEDQPRTAAPGGEVRWAPARRGPLTPVFREPTE